jgi:hypothetical protein
MNPTAVHVKHETYSQLGSEFNLELLASNMLIVVFQTIYHGMDC